MYGFLTIEDAQKIIESGFCIILDGDKKEAIIKNEELDYADYQLSKIKDQYINIFDGVCQSINNVFRSIADDISPIVNSIIEAFKKLIGDDIE